MDLASKYVESINHESKLLESFKNSIACNDTSYHEGLFNELAMALKAITPIQDSFSLAIWASPIVDSKDGRLMAIYTCADDLERGRRTVGKPGKLLRKLAPIASDSECAKFAEVFKDKFVTPLQGMVVKSGNTPEDFAQVYTQKQAPKSDPRLGHDFKSLSASCMRYSFENLSGHPASIYGSGDFEIAWVENSAGELLARVVVATRKGRYAAAPIYTNSNAASDMLQKYIREKNAACDEPAKESWINCKLLKVDAGLGGDSWLGPYADQYQSIKDCGEYFRICRAMNAEYSLDSTEGVVGGYEYQCENCGCGCHEDESYYSERLGASFCESCYNDFHFCCSDCGDMEPEETSVTLINDSCVCEYCFDHGDYVSTSEGVCHIDEAVFCEESEEWFHIDSGDFFECPEGEIRSNDLKAPVAIDCTYEQAVEWYVITTKIVEYQRNGETYQRNESVFTLKPWLEYSKDEYGNVTIVNHQLDLFETEES